MDFSSFYTFDDGLLNGALQVDPGTLDKFALGTGEVQPAEPIVCRQYMGKRLLDLVGTGYAGLHLLSARVIDALREHGFTGWRTYPVKVMDKKGGVISGYSGFSVIGRCGPVDWSKGLKVRRPPRRPGGREYDAWIGIYFAPESWDGSDFFVPDDTLHTIVTTRVKEALERAKFSNIRFERLTDFERCWPEPMPSKRQP